MRGLMNHTQTVLRQLTCNNNVKIIEYEVSHNNGTTSVRKAMYVETIGESWVANIDFKDLPKCGSAKEAAHKLGDWMVRLGEAIKNESKAFESIEL